MSVPRRVEFEEPPRSGGALRRMLLKRKAGDSSLGAPA